ARRRAHQLRVEPLCRLCLEAGRVTPATVGTLRKRGRVGAAALTVVPAGEIDVRLGRPPAPERLSDEERALWEKLTFSRRPGWFSGAESLLESYVTTVSQVQQLEAALRKAKPGTGERYQTHLHQFDLLSN